MATLRELKSRTASVLRSTVLSAVQWWLRRRGDRDDLSRAELRLLCFGWGNTTWAASPDYLRLVIAAVRLTDGAIVEAGSGLTTLVLDAVTPPGRRVVALEHHDGWASRVNARLREGGATVLSRPLQSYGEFDWYGVAGSDLPADVGLVIVDGPPGTTRGGRVGALPVLAPVLRQGAMALVDDAGRQGERAVLHSWQERYGVEWQLLELPSRPAARVIVTDLDRLRDG